MVTEDVRLRIVQERDGGKTLRAIAEGLNGDRIPTAHGGAKWHASTVRAILTPLDSVG